MDEMGYLKKVKGRDSNRSVRSEIFWTGVERAVNFFEPLANLLRRMDSDVPAMGFIYGAFLDAKKEIAARFDNEKASIQEVLHIIDKRWDNKLKGPLHRAGYFLNPYYYYENKLEIELDGTFKDGLVACMEKMVRDGKKEDIMTAECQAYQNEEGSFGRDSAKRQRRNKNFDPAEWWSNHGSSAPNLRVLAMRILSLTCSSSACERNFSVFQQVQGSKRRNRLLHDKMRDLVFIKANSQLEQKRMNKDRDPLVDRTHADVWKMKITSGSQELCRFQLWILQMNLKKNQYHNREQELLHQKEIKLVSLGRSCSQFFVMMSCNLWVLLLIRMMMPWQQVHLILIELLHRCWLAPKVLSPYFCYSGPYLLAV
ncbi:uncharacterized protein [Aegilops tauschii subsp. strangulata]|nr:uncharacterized protein LOC109763956 [Aegilops tauschii subsp. strangulata]